MWTNILFVVTLLERVVYVPDIYLRSSKKLALKWYTFLIIWNKDSKISLAVQMFHMIKNSAISLNNSVGLKQIIK